MSLSSTNITSRLQNITLCFSIIILCLLSITFLTGNIFGISLSSNNTNNASALTYSSTTDVSFAFSPKLSISLSDTNLVIDTLVPGQTSTSNAITITVASNTPYGYSLYADAGSNNTSSPYYNTSSLTHEDNTINNTFTSIATNASLTSLTTDNTWGYSTSTDNGTTWSVYNGLLPTTSTSSSTSTSNPSLLIDTKDPADSSKSIDFKVAARASTTQASGTYGNVINFYAVGKPQVFYMQDAASIKTKLTNTNDTMQAIDVRDGKEYWVTKLADGNIWMTQNLDLDIEAGRTYTSADTDLANSFMDTRWVPSTSTSTTDSWNNSTSSPFSYDPGNLYWNGSIDTSYSGNLSTGVVADPSATPGGTHYHIGNYYNWTAAMAMNDSSSYVKNYVNLNRSICPAGWRLPVNGGDKSYVDLKDLQGFISGTGGNIQNNPTYFVYGGYFYGSSNFVGSVGYYWIGIINSRDYSYLFSFTANGALNPQSYDGREIGFSVRCVMR